MNIERLRRALLRWFRCSRRPLPWRVDRDPYRIWVSEVMLQQTTVATVIPYFERFVARFPDLRSLARADETAVLSLWSGLGYYSRARNLRLGAQQIMTEHEGAFPRDLESALLLKGVGPYTARAVTSIAYGAPHAVVDGNVRRVLARLYADRDAAPRKVQRRADALLPRSTPGEWNEAAMELGATVCTPRNPRCDACPVAADCRGHRNPQRFTPLKSRPVPSHRAVWMALAERDGSVLLERRTDTALMNGLLDLPSVGQPGDVEATPGRSLEARYAGVLAMSDTEVLRVRHTITRYRIDARVMQAAIVKRRIVAPFVLIPATDLRSAPLSGLARKTLRALGRLQPGRRETDPAPRSGRLA